MHPKQLGIKRREKGEEGKEGTVNVGRERGGPLGSKCVDEMRLRSKVNKWDKYTARTESTAGKSGVKLNTQAHTHTHRLTATHTRLNI